MSTEFEFTQTELAAPTVANDPFDLINYDAPPTPTPTPVEIVVSEPEQPSEETTRETVTASADPVDPVLLVSDEECEDAEYNQKLITWMRLKVQAEMDHEQHIKDLNDNLLAATLEVAQKKESLKAANDKCKACLSELREAMVNGANVPPKPTRTTLAVNQPTSEEGKKPIVESDWRKVLTYDLLNGMDGLGQKKLDAIVDMHPTLGHLEDARGEASKEFVSFAKKLPKGFGEGLADRIQERMLNELQKRVEE